MKKIIFFIFILLATPMPLKSAPSLADKLAGKIILQVEEAGEAWYIYPGNRRRVFLARPADAFRIMGELGLGISENTYNSFNGRAPRSLSGMILLRVEANGEAYYVLPDNLKMYYLGNPADAFKIMGELGLGISNNNLNQIPFFQKYKKETGYDPQEKEELNKKISELRNYFLKSGYSISQNRIIISRIGVNAPIIESRSQEYGLSKGMWRVPYSSTPDKGGNTVITGHRWKYLPPSELTFYLLDKLEAGDVVLATWEKGEYYYRVREARVVDRTEVYIQDPTEEPVLTLYTCHPIYHTENRLVIVADLITE